MNIYRTEAELQKAVVRYLRSRKDLLFTAPLGERLCTDRKKIGICKSLGFNPGFADLMIYNAPGLAIELKHPCFTHVRPSPTQSAVAARLRTHGWVFVCTNQYPQAISMIEEMYGKKSD